MYYEVNLRMASSIRFKEEHKVKDTDLSAFIQNLRERYKENSFILDFDVDMENDDKALQIMIYDGYVE